ncbi:MAG: DSBA oxidoreductase [candidate division WS6 bacterium GW2011_GWF2_39_15]|uniref:DSBA oxidoreductase n=1 Tax=candidate division WS6 bacterium GW2011_GWF2_39_15 TaxID=1619100 RepID=A0A0G0MNV3_9BACT|nr:MAG: DSBA oxidoreductase [candidate division WS6 bacterium GW2011_GWF2_39_15]
MAKIKDNPSKETKGTTMVLDMDKMMVPFSILIAGLMIALAVLFGLRGGITKGDDNTGSDTNTDTNTNTDTTTGDGTATISIDDDPYLGDKKKAKVAIVEFSDYECPYCQRHFTDTYPSLVKDYVDSGKAILVFRDYPLSFHDPMATNSALAAQCVFDLGGNEKYFEYHDLLFKNTKANGEGFSDTDAGDKAKLEEYAKTVGVDVNKFKSCYSSKKFAAEITKDLSDGTSAGISGTPGFIIGELDKDGNVKDGQILAGAYPYADFKAILDKLVK